MKKELDLMPSIIELMQQFKEIASSDINEDDAKEYGFDLEALKDPDDLGVVANILLLAGLEHFKEKFEERMSPMNRLKKTLEELMCDDEPDNGTAVGIGHMTISPNGVEISDDVPDTLREVLERVGESIRDGLSDVMGETGHNECDCPSCQFRRAHQPTKGKFS